jgi:2'-5' RNA ligase
MTRAGYNFYPDMQNPRYALVAYVKNPVGEFVENLRRELHPDLPHLAAHVTILPPRLLQGNETLALQMLEKMCALSEPFEVSLGDVVTFLPDSPTVYIRIDHGANRMCELHDRLNTQALAFNEEWPYVPHLTIVKMATQLPAKHAFRVACERWSRYSGERRILLEHLTFVREVEPDRWVDLAPVTLGRTLVSRQARH